MIDHDKLNTLEERHNELQAANRARFDRYLDRLDASKEHLRAALVGADHQVKWLTLESLNGYSDDELDALDVNVQSLQRARFEDAAAKRLLAEHTARKPALAASARLIEALKKHAFPTVAGSAWSVHA
jgi:hypothetical protein